jgi:general secretion pathway protein B
MSLILEALKKSEAERRLGETPSLSTLPVWKPKSRSSRGWWLLVPAIAIAAAAVWSNRDLLDGQAPAEGGGVAEAPAQKPSVPLLDLKAPDPEPVVATQAAPLPQRPVDEVSGPKQSAPAAVAAAPTRPMPEPQPLPQSMDDLDAMKGISPENQRRIRSGELFVPSPSLLSETGPTTETPIITAESALPPPLPEPDNVEQAAMPSATPTPPATQSDPVAVSPAAATPQLPVVTAPSETSTSMTSHGVPLIYDLTLNQRQGLPALKMSMHVYNRDAARRFVIIDGQRLNEDGVMGNQLWAREIVPDGVIIQYNDIRFLLPRLGG